MLGDMTRLTSRSHHGRESKGGQCGLGAHMEACRGVGVQETEMAWLRERTKETLIKKELEARQCSSFGIPSICNPTGSLNP